MLKLKNTPGFSRNNLGPRSRRRPLSATQHHPTTSLAGMSNRVRTFVYLSAELNRLCWIRVSIQTAGSFVLLHRLSSQIAIREDAVMINIALTDHDHQQLEH